MKDLICDYDYKCLAFKPGDMSCPHVKNCDTVTKAYHKSLNHYQRHSYGKKSHPTWTKVNPSMIDIKKAYRVALQNGLACPYCNRTMTLDSGYTNSTTIDHLLSRGLGGGTTGENLIVSCLGCNKRKCKEETKLMNGVKT